jgi:hypothetical protein
LFNVRTVNELICRPQSDRLVIDRGRRVFAELPDYGELDDDRGSESRHPADSL